MAGRAPALLAPATALPGGLALITDAGGRHLIEADGDIIADHAPGDGCVAEDLRAFAIDDDVVVERTGDSWVDVGPARGFLMACFDGGDLWFDRDGVVPADTAQTTPLQVVTTAPIRASNLAGGPRVRLLSALSAREVYVVADDGLHTWNGSIWRRDDDGTVDVDSVVDIVATDDDVFAIAYDGSVHRRVAAGWVEQANETLPEHGNGFEPPRAVSAGDHALVVHRPADSTRPSRIFLLDANGAREVLWASTAKHMVVDGGRHFVLTADNAWFADGDDGRWRASVDPVGRAGHVFIDFDPRAFGTRPILMTVDDDGAAVARSLPIGVRALYAAARHGRVIVGGVHVIVVVVKGR